MNYEKMIAVNRIESEQKIKLATMAIEQLIERGEYPSVTLLVKKTGLSRGFFYKNPEVRSRLDAAVQSPNVSCRRIWSESKLEIQNKITVYKNLNYQYPVYFGYE